MANPEPLALPLFMKSGTTPQSPWIESFPYQLGEEYLNELRNRYKKQKKRLTELLYAKEFKERYGAYPVSGSMAMGDELRGITDAQISLEIQRLQDEIKELERTYPFLTEPETKGANWVMRLAAEKIQQDIDAGLLSPEEGLKQYNQVESYISGATPPQTPQMAGNEEQVSEPSLTETQIPYAARLLGYSAEEYNSLPQDIKEKLPYVISGIQPPESPPWYVTQFSPSQLRSYLNTMAGKPVFDPMEFFKDIREQSIANRQWRQQMALAERELAAQIANQQAAQELERQQLAQQMAMFQQELAAQQAYQQAMLEQQKREMAAQIGQNIAAQQSQNWANALPYVLPYGTTTPPGFETGGPVNALVSMAGQTQYTPMQIAPSPPPEQREMEKIIKRAIDQFE